MLFSQRESPWMGDESVSPHHLLLGLPRNSLRRGSSSIHIRRSHQRRALAAVDVKTGHGQGWKHVLKAAVTSPPDHHRAQLLPPGQSYHVITASSYYYIYLLDATSAWTYASVVRHAALFNFTRCCSVVHLTHPRQQQNPPITLPDLACRPSLRYRQKSPCNISEHCMQHL